MNAASLSHYASQIRQNLLSVYVGHGDHAGNSCARASLRTTAEVLAEMAGREKAVALLDQISDAVLSETKLLELPELLALPTLPPPPIPKPRWIPAGLVKGAAHVVLLRGVVIGFWLSIIGRALL